MDGGERQGRARTFTLPRRLLSSAFMIGLKVGGKVSEGRLPFYVAALRRRPSSVYTASWPPPAVPPRRVRGWPSGVHAQNGSALQ